MIKTFKKSIALLMALVFVISLVPCGVMAEVEPALSVGKIDFSNYAYTRDGSSRVDTKYWYTNDGNYHRIISGAGSTYYAVAQLDFTGYEEIINNPSTTATFQILAGGSVSTQKCQDFKVYIMPDSTDVYVSSDLTHTIATSKKMYTITDRPILYMKSDGTTLGYNSAKGTEHSGQADLTGVISEINNSYDNSLITLYLRSTTGTSHFKVWATSGYPGVYINYDPNEIDNDDYILAAKNKLTWDILSSENIKYVSQDINLPQKINGVTINWESSNEDVINPSSGEVTVSSAASANVTLTANLTYTNILEQTVNESKTFNVRVPKEMVALDGLNDGSTALGTSSVSTIESNGVGGKAENDSYIRLSNTTDSYASVSTANADGIDDVFEFSVLIPEESPGMSINIAIYGEAGNNDSRATLPLVIQSDGIYTNYSGGKNKFYSFNGNKWNTITFVAPKGITGAVDSDGNSLDEKNYSIYVNGVKIRDQAFQTTKQGLAYIRIGTTVSSSDEVTAYLDNIRVYSGEYNPEYDKKAAMSTTTNMLEGKFVVDGVTTYEQVVSSITTDEDTEIRVYDASGSLVTDMSVAAVDGATVVLAARNGTTTERVYSYYKIYDVSGKLLFDEVTIDKANNTATTNMKIFNYSGELKTYNVYWATYCDGELMSLVPETVEVVSGQVTPVNKTIPVDDGYTVKFFVWEEDGITPAIASVEK